MQHRRYNWQGARSSFFFYHPADVVRADRKEGHNYTSCLLSSSFFLLLLLPQKCSFLSVLQSCGSTRQPTRRCNVSSGHRPAQSGERPWLEHRQWCCCCCHCLHACSNFLFRSQLKPDGRPASLTSNLTPIRWKTAYTAALTIEYLLTHGIWTLCIFVSMLIIIDLQWCRAVEGRGTTVSFNELSNLIHYRVPLKKKSIHHRRLAE